MKRIFSIFWIAISVVAFLTSCTDKLEQAILDGYENAFNAAESSVLVRLSDGDYENICSWFSTYAEEQNAPNYNDRNWRWEFIQGILYENYDALEVEKVDSIQWVDAIPALPLVVDVYLDNTSSMKGYINHNHEDNKTFIDVFHAIDDYLFSNNDEGIAVKSYYTQRNKTTKKDEIIEMPWHGNGSMTDQLDHFKMTDFTDSYQLNNFLSSITSRIVTDKEHRHLSFFITDGIPSGPNEKVKGTTWSLDNTAVLEDSIRKVARSMADFGGAFSIYQFEGDFYNGKYWYYDNSTYPKKKDIDSSAMIKRPFYVIVMGDAEAVVHFKKKVKSGLMRFKPIHQVHFAKTAKDIQTKVYYKKNGSDIIEGELTDGNYKFNNLEEERLDVFLSVPLEALPPSFSDENDESLGRMVSLKVDSEKKTDFKKVNGNLVCGPIRIAKNNEVEVEIVLLNTAPTWTDSINVVNDKKEGYSHGTFNFKVLVDGLREGFVGNNSIFFKGNVTIKREN